MSAPRVSPKRWLVTVDDELLNIDYVVRVFQNEDGKLFAAMHTEDEFELRSDQTLDDFRNQIATGLSI